MKYPICFAILLGAGAFAHAASPDNFTGSWSGAIQLPNAPLNITVHLSQAQNGWQGTVDVPAQLITGAPLEDVMVSGNHLHFVIKGFPGTPTLDGTLKQGTIQGTFTQYGQSTSFKLSRQSTQTPPPAATLSDQERQAALKLCEQYTQWFYQGDFDKLWQRLSSQMKSALQNKDGLKATQQQFKSQVGEEQQLLSEEVTLQQGFLTCAHTARYSKAATPFSLEWSFDKEGIIVGLHLKPGAQPSSSGEENGGEPITLNTPTGKLYGTLDLPEGDGPFPVALIIAGSGSTDRNGNQLPAVHTNAYKLLAEGIAQQGIAALRYDKRGVGESHAAMTSEADLRFDTYVDDAVAWVKLLEQDARFNAFIIIGHSEGSLIGILAAQQTNPDAFVSLEGAGFPAADLLRVQLKPQLSPDLYGEVNQVLEQLEAGHTVPELPAGIAKIPSIAQSLFRPSVQPYLISWFNYDPAEEIAKLKIPVLIVQGTTDVQVSMKDAEALAKAAPNAQLKVIEGMNHVLKEAPADRAKNIATYANPDLPLADGLLDAVTTFIKGATSP